MLTEEEKKNLDKYLVREENPETYFGAMYDSWHFYSRYWAGRHSLDNPYVGDEAYGWKFHIHADNDKDWQKVSSVVIPYLRDHDITFKTFNMVNVQKNGFYDKSNNQYGKAFTIYPNNDEEFAKIANDLNYILENNNLNQQGAIHGDHQIGDHGRIFYRNTWTSKDNPHYYANASAENPVYKADDVEDPFLNVLGYPNDNSRAEAMMAGYEKKKVVNRLENLSKAENDIQQRLQNEHNRESSPHEKTTRGEIINIDEENLPLMHVGNQTIDLADEKIQEALKKLKPNEALPIGRMADDGIKLNNDNMYASRFHGKFFRDESGQLKYEDTSTNGTSFEKVFQGIPIEENVQEDQAVEKITREETQVNASKNTGSYRSLADIIRQHRGMNEKQTSSKTPPESQSRERDLLNFAKMLAQKRGNG